MTLEQMKREPTTATGRGARDTRNAPTAPRTMANDGKRTRRGSDPRRALGPHMRTHMQTMTKSKKQTPAKVNPAGELIRECRKEYTATKGQRTGFYPGALLDARDLAALARSIRERVTMFESGVPGTPAVVAFLRAANLHTDALENIAEDMADALAKVEDKCGGIIRAALAKDRARSKAARSA